jgi:hypothetical protein
MRRRETSAETAAKAIALRSRVRVVVDFHRLTLVEIHSALVDRIHDASAKPKRITLLAEQVVRDALAGKL